MRISHVTKTKTVNKTVFNFFFVKVDINFYKEKETYFPLPFTLI